MLQVVQQINEEELLAEFVRVGGNKAEPELLPAEQEGTRPFVIIDHVVIVDLGQAKTELSNYAREHRPELMPRVSGVETVDHPSDNVLVALARKFFKADDRMHSQAH